MALPPSGALSIEDIATEFAPNVPHTHPDSLSEYYGVAAGVPTEGTISIDDFYNTEATEYIVATGGTVSDIGGRRYHYFTSNGTFNVVSKATGFADNDVEIIGSAGGGSGGRGNLADFIYGGYFNGSYGNRQRYNVYKYGGGGGGAGGVINAYEPTSEDLSNIAITVGSGGSASTAGANGGTTTVTGYESAGGGGRGGSSDSYTANSGVSGSGDVGNTGSGGGGSSYYSSGVKSGSGGGGTYSGASSSSSASYLTWYYDFNLQRYYYHYGLWGGGGGGTSSNGSGTTGGGSAYSDPLYNFNNSGSLGRGGNGAASSTGTTWSPLGSGGGGGRYLTSTSTSTQSAASGRSGFVLLRYDI